MAGMEDARVRVHRAKVRFQALEDAIATFRREHPNNETVSAHHDGKGNVRLFARITQQPPREWGLAAGDILVDLRTALDYAVYALAIANGGSETPDHAVRLEFPICDDETRWGQAIGRHKLDGLTDPAIDYIRSLQEFEGAGNALRTLEDLVGINKHRFIYVAWARLDTLRLKMQFEGMDPFTADAKHIPGELRDGAELITFHLVAGQERAKFQVEASLTTKIVIEPTDKGWIELSDLLARLGAYVEHVIGVLEGFLTPGHQAPAKGTPIALVPWGRTPPPES